MFPIGEFGWSHHRQPGGPIPVGENPSGWSHAHGRRQFHNRWPTAASLVRAGFLVVWLQLSVSGFRLVLARSWHGGQVGLTPRQGRRKRRCIPPSACCLVSGRSAVRFRSPAPCKHQRKYTLNCGNLGLARTGPRGGSARFQNRRWGGRGSNPRPADYEKHGRSQDALDQQQCLERMLGNHTLALGFPRGPVHAAVHTEPPQGGYRRDAA